MRKLLAAMLCIGAACGGSSDKKSEPQAVATPAFSVAGGTYATPQSVAITCSTAGAAIHYTTDGTTPTASSPTYSAAIAVVTTTTIKALATLSGSTDSAVASATYVIDAGSTPTATPTLSPAPGTYTSAQSVTITCATAGATVYYTTSGADPTTASTVYSAAIPVSATTTIKALATAPGHTQSLVASGTYTITSGTSFATLCAVFTTVQENLQATCLKVNPALFTVPGDYQFSFCNDLQKELTAGRVVYDSAKGADCLAAFQAITCTELTPRNGVPTPAACNAALTGTVATGGNCYVNEACQSGSCTSDYTLSCPGTCQPIAQLNQPCSSAPCADGLACDYYFSGASPICKTAHGLNGDCPCQDAYWCDATSAPGVCRAFRVDGGACSFTGVECASGFECVGAGLPTPPGTCRALVGGGATCGSTAPCGTGYVCSGTCASLPAVGQPCVQGASFIDCIGGYCPGVPSPTCQAYKAAGTACTAGFECASGQCAGSPTRVCQPLTCSAP